MRVHRQTVISVAQNFRNPCCREPFEFFMRFFVLVRKTKFIECVAHPSFESVENLECRLAKKCQKEKEPPFHQDSIRG